MDKPKPVLYLIPSLLGGDRADIIPEQVKQILQNLDYFMVENEKSARRFLRKAGYQKNFDEIKLMLVNKNTDLTALLEYMEVLKSGHSVGMLSEAGSPAIADPGSNIVSLAHEMNIRVQPLTGPNSIMLALMASGMNGQSFVFHGYLPIDKKERIRAIKKMEYQSLMDGQTQIFMEAPYRNNQLLEALLTACHAETKICIATNLTLPNERVKTATAGNWKKHKPDLHKKPTVFLLNKA
jgi:16S rRNA (cytidine1402-2'-O)-methyltransferase